MLVLQTAPLCYLFRRSPLSLVPGLVTRKDGDKAAKHYGTCSSDVHDLQYVSDLLKLHFPKLLSRTFVQLLG